MKKDKIIKIKYKEAVSIKSPYENSNNRTYHIYVNVLNLSDDIPKDLNPRKVNMKTKVAKGLLSSLYSDDNTFYIKNRGILISAKSIDFNENNVMYINVGNMSENDLETYGILDGGHTYQSILDYKHDVKKDDFTPTVDQYVHLEIMSDISNIDAMSSARNSSVQVSDKAIAELENKFDFVKDSIVNTPFYNRIAYKQNDNSNEKTIDSLDILRLMFSLNTYKYPDGSIKQPIQAYSGKSQVLKDYLKDFNKKDNPYEKIAHLLPDIAKLYDVIEKESSETYNSYTDGGKFGLVKGVEVNKKPLNSKYYYYSDINNNNKISNDKLNYSISQGLLFPILGSFRSLIIEKNGKFEWAVNPFDIWNNVKVKLVSNTIEMSRQLGNNPQSAGKSSTLWTQNYDAVNTEKIKIMYKQIEDKR